MCFTEYLIFMTRYSLLYLIAYLIDCSLMIKFLSKPALFQMLTRPFMIHTFDISFLLSAKHIPPMHLSLPVLARGHPILDDPLIAVA